MAHDQAAVEKTKADFSVEKMLKIRTKSQEAVERIAARLPLPGDENNLICDESDCK